MKTLYILTSSYPYPPGEQFIEDEACYWKNLNYDRVVLLPALTSGKPRQLPDDIELDLSLSQSNKFLKAFWLFPALVSSIFFKECKWIFRKKGLDFNALYLALKEVAALKRASVKLRNILRKDDSSSVFYCYWNNYYSYAACELKNKLSRIKVVSRTHRYDLYESQSSSGYLPLKRQYAKYFDKIFFLSAEGKQYFEERYGIESSSAEVSPLGVPIPKVESAGSNDGEFHVVSLSFCAPIKRIDKIIDAIALFAENNTDVKVRWTHIGGGSLLEMLKELAVSRLGKANNVSFEFAGMMENRLAKDFFVSNPVDVFVNSSESEGIPVSIMEAMSTGIPAIAPNIGGIAFLIDEYNGVLLSDSPDANEISLAFEHVFYHEGIDTLRRRAREKIQNEYSAEINYARFVDTLNNL